LDPPWLELMAKPEIRERLFRWVAVPALAGVLALLAVLQYQWSGQVSAAAKEQMRSNLQVSLLGFRQDFARELGSAGVEIRSALDASATVNPAQFAEQFQHWQQTATHPNLVEHIYIWQDPEHELPLRFDPGKDQLEHTAWPAQFDALRQHLQEVSAFAALHTPDRGPGGRDTRPGQERRRSHDRDQFRASDRSGGRRGGPQRGRTDFFVPWVVDQSIPALAYPVRHPQASGNRVITWLVIQLNRSVLEKEIFPELAQKYFRGQSGLDYHVAVRESSKDGERVIYASDAGFSVDDRQQMDASLNLFGPPFGRAGGPDIGPEMLFTPIRPAVNDRPAQTDERRTTGPERAPRFEVFQHSGEQSIWQVAAKHKSGSVEAAVSGLRRRNLMASFGVLVLLGVTMALILIASQRARRLARLQMDFVTGVSHELRTPLAVISSAAENIAHGVVEDKQQLVRYGNSIVKQTRQLTQLVEQVLQFAATQQAPRSHSLGPVNLQGVVETALESTAATIATAGFTVERSVEPGLPPVSADFNGLVQSLQNLITNAVKYGGESRWLRVVAEAVKEKGQTREIVLSVEDKGIGISKEEIKSIFEPFYRSPAIAESGIHGTGLGLPLARKIVEAMGGRLTAESEVGKGSLFTIHLQVAGERAVAEQPHAADPQTGAEPGFSS
jgi:signal transduction histidine kinase